MKPTARRKARWGRPFVCRSARPDEPDADVPEDDPEEQTRQGHPRTRPQPAVRRLHRHAAPATVSLFGEPFDTYSEAEAIAEGYIVDVAASIISYKTLYNLHCPIVPKPDEEKLYPKGVVSKALQNMAFQDDGLIQYKSEVMLRIFEKDVKPLIGGRAKAMIVTTSRVAGTAVFQDHQGEAQGARRRITRRCTPSRISCIRRRNEAISEHAVNELKDGELIEERFEGDDYRLMIVANKFQTGFDQPLLAGMFLDKPVVDRNAVQTVSRLNRCHEGKKHVVVVDFTNNAEAILKAFGKYRKGTPFEPEEPDHELCPKLHAEILAAGVFTQKDAGDLVKLLATGTDAQVQFVVNALRNRFQAKLTDPEERKAFVYQLARLVKSYHFLTCFFTFPGEIQEFATFAEYVGPQLIKEGSVSELMKQIRQTEVVKAAVEYQGEVHSGGPVKLKPGAGKKGTGPPPRKVSVQDMIAEIRTRFDISDEAALFIKEVTEEKAADPVIHSTVVAHRDDRVYLEGAYRGQVNGEIQTAYDQRGRYEELSDPKYTDAGAIFDIMAVTVIEYHLTARHEAMSKSIDQIPEDDRPREKLLRKGATALSDQELLAILLGKGTPGMDVMTLAGKLAKVIDEKGLEVKADDLMRFPGVGDAKATLILAAIEFARRRIKPEGAKIVTPADLLPHVRHYADRKQEHFLCATINGANEILNIRVVSIGLIDRSPVHPREVFADALSIALRRSSSRTTTPAAVWNRRQATRASLPS